MTRSSKLWAAAACALSLASAPAFASAGTMNGSGTSTTSGAHTTDMASTDNGGIVSKGIGSPTGKNYNDSAAKFSSIGPTSQHAANGTSGNWFRHQNGAAGGTSGTK